MIESLYFQIVYPDSLLSFYSDAKIKLLFKCVEKLINNYTPLIGSLAFKY